LWEETGPLPRVEQFGVQLRGRQVVQDVALDVRAGEIVGIAGLQGSGNSELLMGLFGAWGRGCCRGRVLLDGRETRPVCPRRSIRNGVALLTSDRKANGLVLSLSVMANTTLAQLERFSLAGWRRGQAERAAAADMAAALHLRAASLDMDVGLLSGGNQQKVALAKWILTRPRVLLLDEPTRGVDVGAKREIYELMDQWTAQGIAILLVSSEMPELLALSDRVVVMHRGRVTARYRRGEATPERVLEAAMGRFVEVESREG
jgi:ABC-type sugar transport system ATPase subunit